MTGLPPAAGPTAPVNPFGTWEGWFGVEITGVIPVTEPLGGSGSGSGPGVGTLTGPPVGYTFKEREIGRDGSAQDKRGGRINTELDLAFPLDGTRFDIGDFALCRTAKGAPGKWELVGTGGGPGGGSDSGSDGCCITLEDEYVSAVSFDPLTCQLTVEKTTKVRTICAELRGREICLTVSE